MNGEQRYLLDLQGYLHIRGALAADELGAAQRAADRVVAAEAAGSLPDGAILEKVGESYSHYDKAFTVEKDLEALVFHLVPWLPCETSTLPAWIQSYVPCLSLPGVSRLPLRGAHA